MEIETWWPTHENIYIFRVPKPEWLDIQVRGIQIHKTRFGIQTDKF